MNLQDILEFVLFEIGNYTLTIGEIVSVVLILLGAKLIVTIVVKVFFKPIFKRRKIDEGRRFALKAFLKYVIYTLAILWALHVIGDEFSVVFGGTAALLVGIGLGLQQVFSDLVSGVILLSEGTVEVGNVVTVDNVVGEVIDIGIRTSKVKTRDDYSIIVPNSKLISDKVINWSHNKAPNRFCVPVGVAYSSDVQLVKSLLLKAVEDNNDILKDPAPQILFNDFGNSSFDFELYFYSNKFMAIEFVKSDVRYRIIELFRENNIEIPFPQNDLWFRNKK